jgi:hypothetical protein
MMNPGATAMVSGGNAILAFCGFLVIYGMLKVKAILASFSSCDMDGCELKRLYTDFKNDVENNHIVNEEHEFSYESFDQEIVDFMLDHTPSCDRKQLH